MTRLLLPLALVTLLGCTPTATPAPADTSDDAVLDAREALGEPMLKLAESVLAVAGGLDQARFDVTRGDDMQAAVKALAQRRDAVARAQQRAATAAEQAPVADAAAIVAAAADQAEDVLPEVDAELRYLRALVAVDRALFDAAATWDEPGSQSEIRERLLDLAEEVERLRPRVRRLRPSPARCTAAKRNRLDWLQTVRTRTLALQEQANSAGGSTFDELRKSYRALPFAVEPRTADRVDRQCWLDASAAPAAADDMRAAVDELRTTLSR